MRSKASFRTLASAAAVCGLLLLVSCGGTRSASTPARSEKSVPVVVSDLMLPAPPALDTVRAGEFDFGKMWTFDFPPIEYFNATYGMATDEAWFEHVRLATLRLPNCTASFVSPEGLVMTNNHCVREQLTRISRDGENLNVDGFSAMNREEERAVAGWFADQLIAVEDVTAEVDAAMAKAQSDAERVSFRQDAIGSISARIAAAAGGAEAGITVQIISLYNGGRSSAYTFRRFTDLRMVFSPEHALGAFGGDYDNFTYPRYDIDAAFFRIYVDEEPYRPQYHFKWSATGIGDGEPVFIIGNPGSTIRLETTAQLAWRRDVQEKHSLDRLRTMDRILTAQHARQPYQPLMNTILSIRNSMKAFEGRVAGLNNPIFMARKADSERQFLAALKADPELQKQYGSLVGDVDKLVREKMAYAADYQAFIGITTGFSSATLRRAMASVSYLRAKEKGTSGSQLNTLAGRVQAVPDQDPATERAYLENQIRLMASAYGAQSALVAHLTGGKSPAEVAEAILASSVLASDEAATKAVNADMLGMDDPAVALISVIYDRMNDYTSAMAGFSARESVLNAQLGRARFAVYGTSRPPDATFSLRIADGVVKGYPYNGTIAPPFATFYGMYDRFYGFGQGAGMGVDWDLPARWRTGRASLDLSIPVNFVSTNDIIGGNSGSPMINRDLEVVGVAFDGNVESLPWWFIYTTEVGRTVSVDVRGLQEAMDKIYGLGWVVDELKAGAMVGR